MQNVPNGSPISRLIVVFTAIMVMIVGLSTLFGLILGDVSYAIPASIPVVGGNDGTLPTGLLALVFVRLAVIVLAFSILIGVVNLIVVNAQRTLYGRTLGARATSAMMLLMFIMGLLAPVISPNLSDFLLENVQTTIESSLAALIFFALVYGAFRMLRRKITFSAMLFILTVEIVLIGALPASEFGWVRTFTDWLINVPVNAGARGILLGIALATLITGLRVLIGQDRTYGE